MTYAEFEKEFWKNFYKRETKTIPNYPVLLKPGNKELKEHLLNNLVVMHCQQKQSFFPDHKRIIKHFGLSDVRKKNSLQHPMYLAAKIREKQSGKCKKRGERQCHH